MGGGRSEEANLREPAETEPRRVCGSTPTGVGALREESLRNRVPRTQDHPPPSILNPLIPYALVFSCDLCVLCVRRFALSLSTSAFYNYYSHFKNSAATFAHIPSYILHDNITQNPSWRAGLRPPRLHPDPSHPSPLGRRLPGQR